MFCVKDGVFAQELYWGKTFSKYAVETVLNEGPA
jgi:hypothetical protein